MLDIALPTQSRWNELKLQGAELIKSGFLPSSIKTPEQFMMIILKGRELGIQPLVATSKISVIQGKPTMDAELMLAKILEKFPATQIEYPIYTNEECKITVKRPGWKASSFSFTIEDAKKAGLMGKDTWQKYPRAMLRSRCIAEMARAIFPDVLCGVSHTPEELGATVTESGDVIDVTPQPIPTKQPEAPQMVVAQKDPGPPTPFDETFEGHIKIAKQFLLNKKGDVRLLTPFTVSMHGKPLTLSKMAEVLCNIDPESPDNPPENA